MGDLQRDRGAFSEADALYHKSLQLIGNNEIALRMRVLLSRATLQRWAGELNDALAVAQNVAMLAATHSHIIEQLRAEACVVAIHVQQGELTSAPQQLDKLADEFEQHHAQTRLIQTLGFCAYAALQVSDADAAHQYLKRAMDAVNHPASLQPLAAEVVHSPVLKKYVMDHKQRFEVLVKEVQKLELAQLQPSSPEPYKQMSHHDGTPTFNLRVWTLGQERIERDGQIVPLSAWRAATARELFYYLLFKGPAPREQVGLIFWPDISPQQLRQTFHTTLHRIRNAVGTNTILFEDDLYFINPEIEIWCDTQQFETAVQQARLTSPLIAYTEDLLYRAVELYKGDLLTSSNMDWIAAYRETLHEVYITALLSLGNCIHTRGNAFTAITIFKRALELDPFREDTYRALMRCYAGIGERMAIGKLLQNLTSLLKTELNVAPSLETLSLAQALLA